MNPNRKTAIIAGVLIILGMVAGVLSVVYVIEEPDYLLQVAANEGQVLTGAFFQFMMIPAYIGFALLLYPILRKYNESLAAGFVGFRFMAGTFHLIGVISLPLFLLLSHEFIKAGAPDASYFQTIGWLLRSGRDLVNHVGMILALSLGNLMFFYVLYQAKLIPRWLSGWGFVGTTLTLLASLLLLFRLIDVVTPIYMGLNLPMALQEMVFAVWLIFKGFNPLAITAEPVKNRYE
jgi:hypothetical protein